jgi:hypothetical protein
MSTSAVLDDAGRFAHSQTWGYLDALHRAGNNLVEMEPPYAQAQE